MQTYKAAVDAERLWKAQIAARKLPAAILEASLEVEKNSADFDPVSLERQSNRGPVYSGLASVVRSANDKSRFRAAAINFCFLFSVFCFCFGPSFIDSVFGDGFSACMNTVMCKDTVVSIYDMRGWVGTPVRA